MPYWFKTPLSSDAAVHDLAQYKSLLQYSDIDSKISMAVLKVQSRHLWYLLHDSIILWSMFVSVLTDDEKSRLACVLLSKLCSESFPAKKVKFLMLTPNTKLQHLNTSTSRFLFILLNLGYSWLELPPASGRKTVTSGKSEAH